MSDKEEKEKELEQIKTEIVEQKRAIVNARTDLTMWEQITNIAQNQVAATSKVVEALEALSKCVHKRSETLRKLNHYERRLESLEGNGGVDGEEEDYE